MKLSEVDLNNLDAFEAATCVEHASRSTLGSAKTNDRPIMRDGGVNC